MDSKEEPDADDHWNNAVTENSDTIALHKKRARRVSFAERTSVRYFDRDDEGFTGTPLMETAKIGDDSYFESGSGGKSERNKEFEGVDNGDDNDEDNEEMEMRSSFLRPIGSPSPGGSTFGSASSNDEDNFFGPVSANFIRPGRLSDSAASDDNHDVTMDSTAFSMHYRSLATSESGIDLKTPTGGQLFFEEKTPTNSNTGSSMVVTLDKKHIKRSSVPVAEASGIHSSNDMSLVGEYPNKYDFDKLSPGLDAILVEGKNLLCVGVSDDITSVSPKWKADKVLSSVDPGDNLVKLGDSVWEETNWINSSSMLNGGESAAQNEINEANSPHGMVLSDPSPNRFTTYALDAAASRDNHESHNSSNQLSKNESGTSLVTSTSSPVKQQQTLPVAASPSKPRGFVSPFLAQPGSLLKNGSLEHQETETSIQKSISKLELLEKSAFSAKIDKSTVKSLDFSKSPNFDNLLEKKLHISTMNFTEDSVPEGKAASVNRSTGRTSSFSTDQATGVNHLEPLGLIISGKSPYESSSKNIFADQLKSGAVAASPSKISWSGNNLKRSLFTPKPNNEDSILTETESLLREIASGGEGKVSPNFVSSPGRMLVKELSVSSGFQRSQLNDLLLQSRNKQFTEYDKVQDSTSERNLSHVNLSSATANKDALSKRMEGVLNSPFIEVNHLNLLELNATNSEEMDIQNLEEMIGTIGNFSTPAKENESQVMHSKNLDVGNLTSRDFSSFEDNIPREETRMFSHDNVSSSSNRNLDRQTLQKSLVEFPAGSPSKKVLYNKLSTRTSSPKSIHPSGRLEKISANKRNLELLLSDIQHKTETTIMGRSPKLQKGGNYYPESIVHPVEGRTELTVHEKKKWTDAYFKFTQEINFLIFGSGDELNNKMIDVLEDTLVHQQRSKVFEMLNCGVMPQNMIVHQGPQLEKIADANSVLHRVVFEKAILQLKHAKKEILLKRLELLNYRMQESQNLGANIASLRAVTCPSNVQVEAVADQALSVNLKKDDVVWREKLTATRQTLEALDRKKLNLTRNFQTWCKMKAEPSIGNTIALVNEHLMKRASCRFIRMDMQIWVVQSVGIVNGQPNVLLNYLDFIMQSTKIIVGPTSSARTSFELKEAIIIKSFPNMDACIAFKFVFDGETVRKYIGAKTLIQETQVTNSLLGTLLDVIEEVQLAQIEFHNLTHSSFCSPSAERLELMLCFFNFNSGKKVILTLDISCLKRGIYPLELQMKSPVENEARIFDEIRNAVKGVRSGYMRILRLCRCASQVVKASTA
ncbi:hypothetical protein ACS0TY_030074 [Phlomoides rotata]